MDKIRYIEIRMIVADSEDDYPSQFDVCAYVVVPAMSPERAIKCLADLVEPLVASVLAGVEDRLVEDIGGD